MLNKIKKYCFFAIIFLPITIMALPTDKSQPVNVHADSADLNQKTGINIFNGHVTVIQGTTQITADKLTTYSDAKRQITKAIAIGTPANYQTVPKAGQAIFQASANTIEYMPAKHQVILIGNGTLQQNGNILQSDYIIYNELTQQLITKPYKNSRTTITLEPQK